MKANNSEDKTSLVSVDEYRNIIKDSVSSNEHIIFKLKYLENFCRKIIHMELEKFTKVITPNEQIKKTI